MANEYSTVDCAEEHGTAQESWDKDKLTASVQLSCTWANRHALAADILGNRRAWPGKSTGLIPTAKSCSIAPVPSAYTNIGQMIVYTTALVTVQYSYGDEEDLLSESVEPSVEFLKLDYRRFRWGAANGDLLLEGEAPGRQIKRCSIQRQWFKVNAPLSIDLLDLAGSVNSSSLVLLNGITAVAETLLYQPPSLSRTVKLDGSGAAWDVTTKFEYMPVGWNVFWRAKTQAYERMWDVRAGAVYNNYPLADLSGVWEP